MAADIRLSKSQVRDVLRNVGDYYNPLDVLEMLQSAAEWRASEATVDGGKRYFLRLAAAYTAAHECASEVLQSGRL